MQTRRDLVVTTLAASVLAGLAPPRLALAQSAELPATPACGDAPTRAQTEGPYFLPSSPRRADFRGDGAGPALVLSGFVLTRRCQPVANALVDLWHADARGEYDVNGYRFRGHVFTDAAGRYQFVTVTPGLYPGRTRHFHVKVQPRGGRVLTTQLYFPGDSGNARDFLYNRALDMQVQTGAGAAQARFDFVVS